MQEVVVLVLLRLTKEYQNPAVLAFMRGKGKVAHERILTPLQCMAIS